VANDLTGDFDVVAEFSLAAVNRLLAAMHGIKRFPHSLALRVDDIPQPPDRYRPSVLELIDLAGDPVVHPDRIRVPVVATGATPAAKILFGGFDGIVNTGGGVLEQVPTVPSTLQGRAQLQLSPPTLEIANAAASTITGRVHVRARYLADPGTPPAAEFATGDFVITTSVTQIASQAGSVVNIDLKSQQVQAAFVPAWSSRALSAEDQAGINLLIRNALRTSTLPSNTMLPANIRSMKFKAFGGAEPAIGILLNTNTPAGNPASAQRVFLGGSNFAFGVGADTITAALQPVLDKILETPVPPVSISIPLVVTSATATYSITLKSATAAPQTGRILLTIEGRATSPSWFAPNFDFTMTQAFSLAPSGSTADLVVGDMTLDTSSWLVDRFRGRAMGPMASARDRALAQSNVNADVRRTLDADRNLGGFLRSLLTPARPDGEPQPPPIAVSLTYSAVEIIPSGIVLRGSMAVADPPPAHVEFAEIPVSGASPLHGVLSEGPMYSAFKSWIAGGRIDSYEWKRAGETQFGPRDEHTFVLFPPPPIFTDDTTTGGTVRGPITAFNPMCLTIRGTRLTAVGPVSTVQVSSTYCAFHWFPLLDAENAARTRVPMVALTRPGPDGVVEVIGHTPAARDDRGRGTPNLVLHFADRDPSPALEHLADALGKSERHDAPAGLVAILPVGGLSRVKHVPGVVYVEQRDAEWEQAWRIHVRERPSTFVLEPGGNVVWEHLGELDADTLPATFRRVLVRDRMARVSTITPGVRIGHPPPNFVFALDANYELTLRKVAGRPAILVFWRSDAPLSLDAVRLAAATADGEWKDALVLAIANGESPGPVLTQNYVDLPATAVPDATGAIARAYGVSAWPTTVFVDARGVVRDVRHHIETRRER